MVNFCAYTHSEIFKKKHQVTRGELWAILCRRQWVKAACQGQPIDLSIYGHHVA